MHTKHIIINTINLLLYYKGMIKTKILQLEDAECIKKDFT